MLPDPPPAPRPGLRERKKARTRADIQRHALRLFREQGYEQTTVAQIADAAEISPSTFFRYFATKEDVVLFDALDPALFAAFAAQPTEVGPLAALRAGMRAVYAALPPDELAEQIERARLILAVPELRRGALEQVVPAIQQLVDLLAQRAGHDALDADLRTYAGAVIGGILSAILSAVASGDAPFFDAVDTALAYLESHLTL